VPDKNERYSRQMRFAPIGPAGQERLRNGFVVVLGCGALGSGVVQNLGRAGVGRLRIVDRDILEMSNLARQVLFEEEDVCRRLPKAVAAAERIRRINSEIQVENVVAEISPKNVLQLIEGAQVVADGTDNMEARFLINDACVKSGVPWVYGGAVASSGMTMTVLPGRSACLRCVLEELPGPQSLRSCNEAGVLNTLTGIVSAIQSNEVLKLLTGAGEPNPGLLRFDVWTLEFNRSGVKRRADCPACGLRRFDYLEAPARESALVRGRSQLELSPPRPVTLDLAALAVSLRQMGKVEYNNYLILLTLPEAQLAIFQDGRVIIQGLTDVESARRLVRKCIPALA